MISALQELTALPNLHPAFIHFPIALLVTALGVDVGCLILRRFTWLDRSAALLYALGTLGAGAAYLTGRQAANSMEHLPGPASLAMWEHGDWALYTLLAFVVVATLRSVTAWLERGQLKVRFTPLRTVALLAALGGQIVLFETADRGGALVYRHGIAVKHLGLTQPQK
jgi:uncharacterized membrane protein